MKKIFYILFFFLNSITISALETKIIYTIESEIITNIDIKNEFKYLLALNSNLEKLDKEKILKISTESAIKEKIKKIELSKYFPSLDVNQKYSDALLKNIYNSLNLETIDQFNKYLEPYGLNVSDIRKKTAIEALWNELIIEKYSSKIEIDEKKFKDKIKASTEGEATEYNLSEIVFEVKNKKDISKKYKEIKKNILEIGFENTASIYSISETAKLGGNIGWIPEKSLNTEIINVIADLKLDEISKPIIISNGILILKITKINKIISKIDPDKELKRLIKYERNKQLNKYSKIYFNKIRKNLDLYE